MSDVTPKILVVDDYAHNRLVYSEWLAEVRGVQVVEAAAGQRALQFAREHEFAMFLLDVNLPDMDGFELAALLRREPQAEATPIVFVTSEASERSYQLRGYRLGAVDFMVSATTLGEILAEKARVFVEMFRKRRELQRIADRALRENRELHERLERFVREHAALRRLATRDDLTGLPNRALFEDRLGAALMRSLRNGQRFAVASVGVDGLDALAGARGPAAADALLRTLAERMTQALRATDTVARVGPDQFALLLESLDTTAGADYVAQKLHQKLCLPVALPGAGGAEPTPGISLGMAVFPDHARDAADLATLAELTMTALRQSGGGAQVYPGRAGR